MLRSPFFPLLTSLLLVGCTGDDVKPPAEAPVPRAWQRLSPASAMSLGALREFVSARGIIHSHSPYSHDGCDGEGLDADGNPDATCVKHLRQGMCDAAEDYVFLTDHAANMAYSELDRLLFIESGDEVVKDSAGNPIGNFIGCGDGRRVLLMQGNENRLMSAGIEKHLAGDPDTRRAAYENDAAETVAAMHDVGALVFVPHTESREPAYLSTLGMDGVEIFNIHASIDPDIRKDYLGLDAYAGAASILPFTRQDEDGPEPDLAILGFFQDLPQYGKLWDPLLETRNVTGIAGTDVHENTFPGILRDGERGDSYRRLMRWISNVALVSGEITPSSVKEALKSGRSYVAFEILGVPEGFDFHAEDGGQIVEMGGQAKLNSTLVVKSPNVWNLDPAVEAPVITTRILRISNGETTMVAEGAGELTMPLDIPGAYRVEVRIVPNHLRPYLAETPDNYIRESAWIFSNSIRVSP